MNVYVLIWANLVRSGIRTINQVDADYREEVKKLLAEKNR